MTTPRGPKDSAGLVVVAAALLFIFIFVLRVQIDEVDAAVLFLFCLPTALLAIRFGVVGGLSAATVATLLVVAWAESNSDVDLGLLGYGSRISTYFLIGGLVGLFAKRAAAALRAAHEAARETTAILGSTTDAVYRLDREGRCVYANPAVADVLGWAPAELHGEDVHSLVHHSHLDGAAYPHHECPVFATLDDGEPRIGSDDNGQEVFWHKDGRPLVVDYRVSPIANGDGVSGVVVTVRDVSEQAYNRDRLRRYAERLNAAETMKARTPIRPRTPEASPPGLPAGSRFALPTEDPVAAVLDLVRDRLDMEIAFLGQFHGGLELFPAVAGSDESLTLEPILLEGTYCSRMVTGRLPNIVADARGDERVRDLPATAGCDIGAYLGVPVILRNGCIYGTLCAISHDAQPDLDDRDVRFMEVLSTLVARELDHRELDIERRHDECERATASAQASHVRALIAALETRDEYTGSHSESVVALAGDVARRLDLSADTVAVVEHTALLHDIGKVGVPDAILQKPGKLDELEWQIMRQHPAIGARLIEAIEPLAHLAPAIRAEHERWDGSGYPDGLAGNDIPIAARIGFACDAYHAMTSDRPYRTAMPHEDAIAELRRNAGTQFDPRVVDAVLSVLPERD